MSYKIVYSKETAPKDLIYRIQIPLAGVLLLLALINGIHCYGGDLSGMKERMMPWAQPQVQNALYTLRENLANGEPLATAVEVFCDEIFKDSVETK